MDDEFFDAIDKYGSFVFWVCPNGCRGFVDWNLDKTEAICRECGTKSTDKPSPNHQTPTKVRGG